MIGLQVQRLLAWAQLKNRTTIGAGEVAHALNLSPIQERKLLSRLARSGLATRLQRGRYLLPAKLPPGNRWSPGEYASLAALMTSLGARYQISGPNAFQAYGFDTQIPNVTDVYNDRLSGRRILGGLPFNFIKVTSGRLGGAISQSLPDGTAYWRAGLARTLVDAVYDWSRFNSLPRAFMWIRERSNDPGLRRELVAMAIAYGNLSTQKRIGYLLESLGYGRNSGPLQKAVAKSPSLVAFDPTRPMRGKLVRRWGMIDNRSS